MGCVYTTEEHDHRLIFRSRFVTILVCIYLNAFISGPSGGQPTGNLPGGSMASWVEGFAVYCQHVPAT